MVSISGQFSQLKLSGDFPSVLHIERLLSGDGFGNKELYSNEESSRLANTINEIVEKLLLFQPPRANKEITLSIGPEYEERRELLKREANLTGAVLLSPEKILQELPPFKEDTLHNTKKMMEEGFDEARAARIGEQQAKKKWRSAAYAAAYMGLNLLLNKGYPIVWEQEESWERFESEIFLSPSLRDVGYKVHVVHLCTALDHDSFFVRMGAQFSKYVDEIKIYYINLGKLPESSIATFNRIGDSSNRCEITVKDECRYEKIRSFHNFLGILKAKELHKLDRWEEIVKGHEFQKKKEKLSP
jgi:hypothetical protein